MKQKRTGWERDRRVHFDEITEEYDKIRWDYPDELFANALEYCKKGNDNATCNKAIEIGAGTGKATKPFLDAGYNVTAVEMGDNMTKFLINKYRAYKEFQVITSTFEDIVLEDDSYDIIFAASAFHWVDAKVGCPKVFRLLKKGGAFVLFRSNWNSHDNEKLAKDIQEIYDKHYYNYYDINDKDDKPEKFTLEILQKPSAIFKGFRFERMEQYGFADVKMKVYDKSNTYDADGYIKLLDTFSDHRALPVENRKALYTSVKNVIEKHGGKITTNSTYQLYMGRKP
jgi:ubiquinone/menaquinone biosynthesis C-methylase UbiE